MKSAFVDSTGCEQRNLEADRVRRYLQVNGFRLVRQPDQADLLVVVTCAVDKQKEAESVALVRKVAHDKLPTSKLVVGGCLPSISPEAVMPLADATFSPRTIENLDSVLGSAVHVPFADIAESHIIAATSLPAQSAWRSRVRAEYEEAKRGYIIRINHGCLLSCSYCVIRLATGRLESVDIGLIEAAFELAVAQEEPTIMLVGGDTGAYGLDIGSDFATLLERLLRYKGNHRIYIHDFNANWLLRGLRDIEFVLRLGSERLRAISIPVQSGSDRILKRMRRPYRANDVVAALDVLRENAPDLLLGSHIIVGFPGETADDFQKTMALLTHVDFDFVTCFRYSEHPAAQSAKYDGKVPEDEKQRRLELLRELLGDSAQILT